MRHGKESDLYLRVLKVGQDNFIWGTFLAPSKCINPNNNGYESERRF